MDLTKAEKMMYDLMAQHNLSEWKFRWNRSVYVFGQCQYAAKMLFLSRPMVEINTEEKCRDTMIHEIAHALVGGSNGHNGVWKAKAQELGGTGEILWTKENTVAVEPKWSMKCGECGHVFNRKAYRQNKRLRHVQCGGGIIYFKETEQIKEGV